MAMQISSPNLYTLAGGGIHVTYTTTGFSGQPHFTYQDPFRTETFTGNQLRIVSVPDLGTVVSVRTVLTIDTGSTTFSLLIPDVQLPSASTSIPISTDGITTMHRFSVIPQFNHGQREFYSITPLTGTASHVLFALPLTP